MIMRVPGLRDALEELLEFPLIKRPVLFRIQNIEEFQQIIEVEILAQKHTIEDKMLTLATLVRVNIIEPIRF